MKRYGLIVLASLLSVSSVGAVEVEVWLTRGDQAILLGQRPSLSFQPGSGSHTTKINVDPTTTYQTMEGFGAAMTDASAWLIQSVLTPAQRDTLLEQLFSPQSGIGISYLCVPMGASDFSLTAYTYDDLPSGQSDPALASFSIAHDQSYIIPTLQQALGLNPGLGFFAAPWSPPAWMKTSASLFGGSLKTQYYDTYAQYFVKFLEAYAAKGVPIHTLSTQNEPLHDSTAVPSMSMATFEQSAFIGGSLGPALSAAGLTPGVLAYDHNWDQWNYPVVVLNDPQAGQYAAGAAFHGYAGDVTSQTTVHDFFPDKDIYFTEVSGGDWAPDFGDNLIWNVRNIIIGATRNWAKTVLFWNLALDENHGPHLPGGCGDCRGVVTIDSLSGNTTFEVEYYVIAHASRFVMPGAVRIASDSIDNVIETVAFQNPDGSEVLIALNPDAASRWFDVVREGAFFSYRLTGRSVATFRWPPSLPGDYDGDGDVDLADFAILADCQAGPELTPSPTLPGVTVQSCRDVFDFDLDSDVDLADFAAFEATMFGPTANLTTQ